LSSKASREKRQEFSAAMGQFADELTGAAQAQSRGEGPVLDRMSAASGDYIGKLAEQERRFGNRRIARSVSLAAAHEALALRQFKEAAAKYLRGTVQPSGYAARPERQGDPIRRTVCLLLSDLHIGADLSGRDNPEAFGAVEEARRLEYVVRQALDYKRQYREESDLLLILDGDLIDGYLLHDLRDGAPLVEQKVAFWRYFRVILGLVASAYKKVRVECQPGNHGRDKLRHPGRATAHKWDGHEWEMYYALSQMCSELRNVSWSIPMRAVSIVDLYGQNLLVTHGDTEVRLGDPDTKAERNAAELDKINATRIYGVEFAAACFGHFHKPRYIPGNVKVIHNGALIPPPGYARTAGWIREGCVQFLWEAVEGYAVGDVRPISVGRAQDRDERLGTIVQPFRFED
jgi:hypothetical protein